MALRLYLWAAQRGGVVRLLRLTRPVTTLRAVFRTAVFLLKVFPMIPSRPVDWVTPAPVVERIRYPSSHGEVEGDLYRPSSRGPHPALLVCLGVVPFGVEHPQVPRLGGALARAGFAALLYWSPAMRNFRLDPVDAGDIALAYDSLLARPDVRGGRSGLLGTCVGGAFAVMAASDARIRDRVAFVLAYAPYASMWTFARDIASASRPVGGVREAWDVDPLTRKVYVHSVTDHLAPEESELLRAWALPADAERPPLESALDPAGLSPEARRILPLLGPLEAGDATAAMEQLPATLRDRLTALSPVGHLAGLRAPLVVLLHDRDDPVIPVAESHALRGALSGLPEVRYTEFTVFKHLDPTRGNPSPVALTREILRLARAVYPVFLRAITAGDGRP